MIDEHFEEYSQTFQQSQYMQRLENKQRYEDFIAGYKKAKEKTVKDIYTYKEKEYSIEYDDLEVKDSSSREWKRGVLYRQLESNLLFVRDYDEFINLFTKK